MDWIHVATAAISTLFGGLGGAWLTANTSKDNLFKKNQIDICTELYTNLALYHALLVSNTPYKNIHQAFIDTDISLKKSTPYIKDEIHENIKSIITHLNWAKDRQSIFTGKKKVTNGTWKLAIHHIHKDKELDQTKLDKAINDTKEKDITALWSYDLKYINAVANISLYATFPHESLNSDFRALARLYRESKQLNTPGIDFVYLEGINKRIKDIAPCDDWIKEDKETVKWDWNNIFLTSFGTTILIIFIFIAALIIKESIK